MKKLKKVTTILLLVGLFTVITRGRIVVNGPIEPPGGHPCVIMQNA